MKIVHKEILKYKILHFLATIVDPEGNHDENTIVAAICQKFELDIHRKEEYFRLNNKLSQFVTTKRERVLFLEIPVIGFIRVWKEFTMLSYKESSREINSLAIIEVNNKEIESKNWEEDKMLEYKDNIEVMFGHKDKVLCWPDIFNICWILFEKGSKDQARSTFLQACESLYDKYDDKGEKGSRITYWAKWIKSKWDDYLWDKFDSNTDTLYCLGLREFISRNITSWLEGSDLHYSKINIFTDTHGIAIDEFNKLEESLVEYIRKTWVLQENTVKRKH